MTSSLLRLQFIVMMIISTMVIVKVQHQRDPFNNGTLIFTIARITGIFNKNSGLPFFLFYFLSYIVLSITAFVNHPNQDKFYGSVLTIFNLICCTVILIQTVVGYAIRDGVVHFLNNLAQCDVTFDKIQGYLPVVKVNDRKTTAVLSVLFLLKMVFLSIYDLHFTVYLAMGVYHVTRSAFNAFVAFLLGHLTIRFEQINDGLKKTRSLDGLCKLHFKLCYLARRLNYLLSFHFFYSFSISIFAMLFFNYYLYFKVKTIYLQQIELNLKTISTIIYGFVALNDESFNCYLIIQNCRRLCMAANDTPKHLHELRHLLTPDDGLSRVISAMSLQFLHQKLSIRAMDYFVVDFGVLATMSTTVLTYLVLFIQLDGAE